MSNFERDYTLFDGELPIDLAWVLKVTDDEKDDQTGGAKKLSWSSSPERKTSSGYASSLGEDFGTGPTTPTRPKTTINNPWDRGVRQEPWVKPFNPRDWEPVRDEMMGMWNPMPVPTPMPTPSQGVNQAHETIPLWSQVGIGGERSIRQMMGHAGPSHSLGTSRNVSRNYQLDHGIYPNVPYITLEQNGEKYWGITADKFTDRLYIGDRGNNDVIVMDPSVGKPVLRFGQGDELRYSRNQLYRPTGVAVDKTHNRLLICDKDNHRICMFGLDGRFISSFGMKGHGPGQFNYPWDIDISLNGNMIAVSDSKNHRIQFFDRFGNYLKKFTVFESNPFEYKKYLDYPRGITFNDDGKIIYCTDFNTNMVISLSVDALEYKMVVPSGKLNRPQGITVDGVGNLLVCDSRKNCVRAISPTGDLISYLNKIDGIFLQVPVDSCILGDGQTAALGINGRIYFF